MISLTSDYRMLGYELFAACPDIFCFTTTRQGGCSGGNYSSFNCSPYCGDQPEAVAGNQQLLLEAMPRKARLIIPHQVHSATVRTVVSGLEDVEACDALITQTPGLCICVSTADCVPLLLYDEAHRVIAAIHAGWRGTVNHIVNRTIEQMKCEFSTESVHIKACIGPSISMAAFEVGEEVYQRFKQEEFDMDSISYLNKQTGKYHIDLWEANRQLLMDEGVPECQIETAGVCTYMQNEQFFSARRLGIHSGRILSGIMIQSEEI